MIFAENQEMKNEFLERLSNKEFKTISSFYCAMRDIPHSRNPDYDEFLSEVKRVIKETGQE